MAPTSDTSTATKSIVSPGVKSVPASPAPSPAPSPAGAYSSHGGGSQGTVAVSLALKRFKLAFIGVIVVLVVGAFMVLFQRGVTLHKVDLKATEANEDSQKDLVETYNSYTGSVVSAVTKPIEAFASMALQMAFLRFAARSLLVPQTAWRVDKAMWLAAYALVYLLLNGFNALNVQLESRSVKPIISASDLSVAASTATNTSNSSSSTVSLVTNATFVVPESTPGNLVTNTVLRTAVVPRVWQFAATTCQSDIAQYEIDSSATDAGIEYGFPIQSWVGNMLPQALDTQTLTISLLNTSTTTPKASQLPVNSTRAAMLVIEGVRQANLMGDFFTYSNFALLSAFNASMKKGDSKRLPDARAVGLLPVTDTNDETEERQWLIDAIPQLLQTKFKEAKPWGVDYKANNDTESGLALTFSSVNLSDRITFDAVTIEAEVNTYKYQTALDADGKTRYFNWPEAACGPKPSSICGVRKIAHGAVNEAYYDRASEIVVGQICLNANGTEIQMSTLTSDGKSVSSSQECVSKSNNSMIVVSIAKRIVADSVIESETARTKKAKITVTSSTFLNYPLLVNPRKIYSITVGRLGWETQDLAEIFGAECNATTASKCDGLQFPLSSGEVIVAGKDALPVDLLTLINRERTWNTYTSLVRLRDPIRYPSTQTTYQSTYDSVAGDILLPHNLLVNSSRSISGDQCLVHMEERLNSALTNHLFMEDGFQPAYTSAMFFLFQNGVVKQAVNMTDSVKTLSFDMNVETAALVASIPKANVYQSLAGCVVLLVGVLFTVFYSSALLSDDDSNANSGKTNATASAVSSVQDPEKLQLAKVSDPRVIAQVMLDEGRFPPMFLERKIVDASGHVTAAEMATFQIASMTLSTDEDDGKRVVVERGDNKAKTASGIV